MINTKHLVLRGHDGLLEGIKVYYDKMPAKKARKVGTKLALCKILNGEDVSAVFVDESNAESPWNKLREFWKRTGGCYERV